MKKKTASIKGLLRKMFFSIALFLLTAVTVYTACMLILLRWQAKEYNDNSIHSYVKEFDNALDRIRGENQRMTHNNLSMKTMALKNSTQEQKIEAEYRLRELIVIQTPAYGMTMICKPEMDYILYHYGEEVNQDALFLEQSEFMHGFTRMISDSSQYVYDQWLLCQEEGRTLLFLVNHYNQVYLCSIIDLNAYLAQNRVYSYDSYASTLVRFDGQTLFYMEDPAGRPQYEAPASENGGLFGAVISSANSTLSGIELVLVTPSTSFLAETIPSLIIYGIVSAAMFVILQVVMGIVDQSLLFPLQEISIRSAELLGKKADGLIAQKGDFEEYNRIRKALNDLVVQKRVLEERFVTTQAQKEHALLQYYQLQTRSHFFINCLKSLYGMAERNNRAQMQAMIIAFSNHLRYIFHDNLSVVKLAEELKEVDDYHRIVSLDLPMPSLLNKKVPKTLMDAEVPQLIIQTFLENTYKHADRSQGILMFHVETDTVARGDEEYLRLHIYDNGGGYPEEILNAINREPDEAFCEYNVGIINLRHRMRILYNENYWIRFYNEAGGAHTMVCIPLVRSSGVVTTSEGGK